MGKIKIVTRFTVTIVIYQLPYLLLHLFFVGLLFVYFMVQWPNSELFYGGAVYIGSVDVA